MWNNEKHNNRQIILKWQSTKEVLAVEIFKATLKPHLGKCSIEHTFKRFDCDT